jgi:RAT1-interacting protein
MASFQIFPRREGGQTAIKRPKHILEFSWDDKHNAFPLDDRSLRYYYPPFSEAPWCEPAPIRLSKGYNKWVQIDSATDYHMNAFLQTIQAHEEQLISAGTRIEEVRVKADVVAWRGILTKIMQCAYDQVDFECNATCFQGTIYIELNHTYTGEVTFKQRKDVRHRKPAEMVPDEVMSYWGKSDIHHHTDTLGKCCSGSIPVVRSETAHISQATSSKRWLPFRSHGARHPE